MQDAGVLTGVESEIICKAVAPINPAAVYLFGSRVAGKQRADSDYDIAILAQRPVSASSRYALQTELARRLGQDVDLVVLNDASPIVARQVLTRGRLLEAKRRDILAAFEAQLPSRYADLKRVRAPAELALIRRMGRA